jgi:hypothetical protein
MAGIECVSSLLPPQPATGNRSRLPAIIPVLSNLPANTNRFLRGLEASLELENEPGLVSKVVLVVVARGDVVNETRQKIIGFYGPDSQVPGDLDIDASTKHQIKGPIAG